MTSGTAGPSSRSTTRHRAAGRLLLIEDDVDLAGLFATVLGEAGHAVTVAPTLASAQNHLGSGSWDLVLLDLLLPDGDGRQLLEQLRSQPSTSTLPVFVASARVGPQARAECIALGADAYFEKPVDVDTLTQAVARRLERYSQQQAQARRDPVTGLPNRAAFLEACAALRAGHPSDVPISIAVLDFDHFLWVRETWGRTYADAILRRAGVRLSMLLSLADCLARWDGSDFVALFTRRTPAEASVALESALETLRTVNFRQGHTEPLVLTFSAGVAELEAGGSIHEALAQADRLCYIAKASGRTRVVTGDVTTTVPSRRVLLAEDDPSVTTLLERYLRREGFSVSAFPNGQAALAAAPKSGAALIITDIEMPELDGLGLIRGIREHPVVRHLPIMVLSGMGDENTIVRAFELGADEYVLKPFSAREVAVRVRRLLRRPTVDGAMVAAAEGAGGRR
jgi:diguanylate cyclase (GGDEF)-like protein